MCDVNPVKEEVENFNTKKLKKTVTEEKNILPSNKDIDQEKAEQQRQQQGK
ncbi:thymosin beta 1 [Betta splendens]|uniref:Thymosin beta 1 n=1 Tax=Betta splendens TaxID=158456 RepID=A0A6P7NPX5_BETSP|nr:thymosin beta 1 [Betta splendens]